MSKGTITICIDDDLIPIVKELQSRREFSAFVQSCLRSHKKIIEAESLEHENEQIERQMTELKNRQSDIRSRLDEVKVQAEHDKSIIELEGELRRLNDMKAGLGHWEEIPRKKRPPEWHEWNNKREAVSKTLKDLGFDFTILRKKND